MEILINAHQFVAGILRLCHRLPFQAAKINDYDHKDCYTLLDNFDTARILDQVAVKVAYMVAHTHTEVRC